MSNVNEQIMEKLVEIEDRISKMETDVAKLLKKYTIKPQTSQDLEPCGKDEYRDPDTQKCVPKFPCGENEHWSEEENKCVSDTKSESEKTATKGEGLTSQLLSGTDEAPQSLKTQWEKEDEEKRLQEQ